MDSKCSLTKPAMVERPLDSETASNENVLGEVICQQFEAIKRNQQINGLEDCEITSYSDKNMIMVKACQKSETNKRIWDKKNHCIYCIGEANPKTDYAKIARHIEKAHSTEHDVMDIALLLPGKSDDESTKKSKEKQRKIMFERIRKKGNFAHNTSVLKEGKGIIIVEKSPSLSSKYTYKDFLPCEYCFAFYHHAELYKHLTACHFAPPPGTKRKYRRVKSLAAMLIYQSPAACDDLRDLLGSMTVDDVSCAIRRDEVLLKFGNHLVRRHWNNDDQNHHISNKLRELGRLFLEIKQICTTVHFRDHWGRTRRGR